MTTAKQQYAYEVHATKRTPAVERLVSHMIAGLARARGEAESWAPGGGGVHVLKRLAGRRAADHGSSS
ncbi:hypothetical protein [Anaeromyxobacter oryzae]|uniref:Uncharacterized protein n=1 Tax=Anaeromyxobacter oryzae TaxID=2918170 RepID=A0ABN6MVE3_9BACT|nr:hypothetical protein [Anaeromyxobacter oryzae]BDG04959.1 hypothetical protein AMOR_39550 [Anaeromyxobacter oryzae]